MLIRPMILEDTDRWMALSREFDPYIEEQGLDLETWYGHVPGGNPFEDYMKTKITHQEAYIATSEEGATLGAVAFSKANRISFLGVSLKVEYQPVAAALMDVALANLDLSKPITTTEMDIEAPHVTNQIALLDSYGFKPIGHQIEEGLPVILCERPANISPPKPSNAIQSFDISAFTCNSLTDMQNSLRST